MRAGLQHLQARWPGPAPVQDAAAQMTKSRSSVRRDAASSCVKRGRQTGIRSAMSARIFPAPTLWKRKPGTDRSTRCANPRWRICGRSGRRGWPLSWSASGSNGPASYAEASSASTQACAEAAAGNTPVRWIADAKRGRRTQPTAYAKGNERHPLCLFHLRPGCATMSHRDCSVGQQTRTDGQETQKSVFCQASRVWWVRAAGPRSILPLPSGKGQGDGAKRFGDHLLTQHTKRTEQLRVIIIHTGRVCP